MENDFSLRKMLIKNVCVAHIKAFDSDLNSNPHRLLLLWYWTSLQQLSATMATTQIEYESVKVDGESPLEIVW